MDRGTIAACTGTSTPQRGVDRHELDLGAALRHLEVVAPLVVEVDAIGGGGRVDPAGGLGPRVPLGGEGVDVGGLGVGHACKGDTELDAVGADGHRAPHLGILLALELVHIH